MKIGPIRVNAGNAAWPLVLATVFVFIPFGRARADIIIDGNNSAGQQQTVTAPGDHIQTFNLIDGSGFSIDINATNGANGLFRINSGVTVRNTGFFSTMVVRANTTLSAFDVRGGLISDNINGVNTNLTSRITTFTITNSGTIEARGGCCSALFLNGTVETLTNSGTIRQTGGAAAMVIGDATTVTNAAGGTISSAGSFGVRTGFNIGRTVGSFINNGTISGGSTAFEVGRVVGTVVGTGVVGLTNGGTITGAVDGLLVNNGSELSAFDNTGGVIESTGAGGAALHLREDQDIAITNAGILRNTVSGNGLLLDTEGQTQDFTNSGTISSTSGIAISAQSAMTGATDGFVNSGTITGGGGTAIDARDAFTLTNSGTVTGAISHATTGALTVSQSGGSIAGNITSTANAAHDLAFNGGTVTGNVTLNGVTANTFLLDGATVTGNVDLGDGGAHAVSLRNGRISGTLDIGTGTTALSLGAAGGDTITVGTLATNAATTTTIAGAGTVDVTGFTANGVTNQSAGTLTGSTLTVGTGGRFTLSGTGVLAVPVINLNGTARLDLNGTAARVTGAVTGGVNSEVFVNGTFTSENSINVGHFEIGSGGVFNMAHDVTATSPTTFTNLGTLVIAAGDTRTVTGNYSQGANGVLQTNVATDTAFGKLVVTGTATLPGNARIDVNVAGGNYNFSDDELRGIISAGTLVSDETFIVTDDSILFDFQALVSGNSVNLCLVPAGGTCGDGSSTVVLDAVVANQNWPAVGAAGALDNIIGDFAANGTSGNGDMDDVINRLAAFGSQKALSDAAAETLPLLTASAAIPIRNTLSGTRRIVRSRLTEGGVPRAGDRALADRHFWVHGLDTRHEYDDHKGVSGFDGDSVGLVIGADADIDERTSLGLAFAHSSTDVHGNTNRDKADIHTYQLIGYGRRAVDEATEASVQVGLGLSQTDGTRTITFTGDDRAANSDYDTYSFHLGGGIGRTIDLNAATRFSPAIRVDYTRLRSEGYTETGAGALNLAAKSSHLSALELGVGGTLRFRVDDSSALVADVGVAYDALNERAKVTSSFVGGGGHFVTRGIDPSPWIGHVGLGMPITLDDRTRLVFRYDVEARENFNDQRASVRFSRRF